MANFHSDEYIMNGIYKHYQEALNYFPENRIVGIFCQGSPNYGLDYEKSDIDTKLIVLPSFDDIAFNRKPVSTTHICENEEHIDFKDLRLYIQTFRKQNLNFLEILFTDFKIVNPQYEKFWNRLVANREAIAHYNPYQAIKSMKGIAMEKYHAMEHPYPSKLDILDKYGYDPKQLHHLLRVEEYIGRYIAGEKYADCLRPQGPEYLLSVKRGLYDLDTARVVAKTAIDNVTRIADAYAESVENVGDIKVDKILDEVQRDAMKLAVAIELMEDEYYD